MNVLITRPDERGQQLVDMLALNQIFAIHQPLFRIEKGRELPLLPSVISSLKAGDYLFAVSRNAIDFAHETLQQTGFGWRADLHYFVVGQGSANYFASLSEQAVKYPLIAETSEGLLAMPEMQDLTGKTVLILRAETGRELFAEQAQIRGAEIKILETYQRVPISAEISEKLSLAKRAGIDTIVATSQDIVASLLHHIAEEDRPWLLACRLLVVSTRTAKFAVQQGWLAENIVISKRADNMTLFEVLLKNLN